MKTSSLYSSQPRVLLVDEHPAIRESLKAALVGSGEFVVTAEAGQVQEALDLIKVLKPCLLVTEISFGKGRNGLELIKQAAHANGSAPLSALVFSMHSESLYSERALRAGARGYVVKTQRPEIVVEGLRRVMAGEIFLSDRMNAHIVEQFLSLKGGGTQSAFDRLTDRELEVFELIGRSFGSRQIAQELCLDPKTIETYRGRIKRKLRLNNSVELHQRALQWLQTGEFSGN